MLVRCKDLRSDNVCLPCGVSVAMLADRTNEKFLIAKRSCGDECRKRELKQAEKRGNGQLIFPT